MAHPSPGSDTVDEAQEARLWERLGRGCRDPLSADELAKAYGQASSPALRAVLAERLGCHGPTAWPLLRALLLLHGAEPALVRALGMTRHPEARDQLLAWWKEGAHEPSGILAALRCWGAQVDPSLIAGGLQRPERASRLAAMNLLLFQLRRHSSAFLLELCGHLLADPRPDVVIACIKMLQRRSDPEIVQAIESIARGRAVQPVILVAIEALGCIGSETSACALIRLDRRLVNKAERESLQRQIRSQFRHRDLMLRAISDGVTTGELGPERGDELAALLA